MPWITELISNKAIVYMQGIRGWASAKQGFQTAKSVSSAIARDAGAGYRNIGFYSHAAIGAAGGAAVGAGYTAYAGDGDYRSRMMRGAMYGAGAGLGTRIASNLYRSPTIRNSVSAFDNYLGGRAQSWMSRRAYRTARGGAYGRPSSGAQFV